MLQAMLNWVIFEGIGIRLVSVFLKEERFLIENPLRSCSKHLNI